MNVFVTGGTGLIGSAVVAELLDAGHTVVGLARSYEAAATLESLGASALRGSITDLEALHEGAGRADGVIHLAFTHDFSSAEALARAVAEEGVALQAMGAALRGTDRALVACSGTPVAEGRPSIESDPLPTHGPVAARARAVEAVLNLAEEGVRSSTVRLPRTVHREGRGGFAGLLTQMARERGVVAVPGDGSQRWPAVHALDVAVLFRLVLEQAPPGTSWHGVADEGDEVAAIAAVIGRRLGLPVESMPEAHFGPLGPILTADQPSSSAATRAALGWQPTRPSLLEDLENLTP